MKEISTEYIAFNPYLAGIKSAKSATSIEPGQCVHPCSLTWLYMLN